MGVAFGLGVVGASLFFKSFGDTSDDLPVLSTGLRWRIAFENAIFQLIATMFTLGLSLLPLTALLIALPAVSPNEAVLTQTVPPATSWFRRTVRRLMALTGGVAVLVALLASAVAIVEVLPLPKQGQLGSIGRKVLGFSIAELIPEKPPEKKPLAPVKGVAVPTSAAPKLPDDPAELLALRDKNARVAYGAKGDLIQKRLAVKELDRVNAKIEKLKPTSPYLQVMLDDKKKRWLGVPVWKLLPQSMVQHWPFVFLTVYALDLVLMLAIGRVPLNYNLRNLVVRWRITGLTALAFTVVVALLVALLAFVNGMYELNNTTGIPGNVIVLSDGSTDELFSNLSGGQKDLRNILSQTVLQDENGATLEKPAHVAKMPGPDGRDVYLASQETYFVMNQAVATRPGETPRRRFLQIRALRDPLIAAKVHEISLYPGGQWFSNTGVQKLANGGTYVQCALGEGAAATLGEDEGKPQLEPGDTFRLGDMNWVVTGIMRSQGKTFGSEVWVSDVDLVTKPFGKNGKPTTLVLRADPDTPEAARAIAYHLQYRYDVVKLKAFQEQAYYAELTKTNETFLTYIVAVAVIMAIGGVFGVMNTMFASIAARIKEVGVLRILGFKRWQILISFMLESLLISFLGGLLGCALGYLANFFEAKSTLSGGGGGGGKSVSLHLMVDYQTVAAGMLFTLVMGRLGGLVPALSALRLKILDSLK
jgi:hypothetical protein